MTFRSRMWPTKRQLNHSDSVPTPSPPPQPSYTLMKAVSPSGELQPCLNMYWHSPSSMSETFSETEPARKEGWKLSPAAFSNFAEQRGFGDYVKGLGKSSHFSQPLPSCLWSVLLVQGPHSEIQKSQISKLFYVVHRSPSSMLDQG